MNKPVLRKLPRALSIGGLGKAHRFGVDILALDSELIAVVVDHTDGEHDYTFPQYFAIDYCDLANEIVAQVEQAPKAAPRRIPRRKKK
jgi:hypothetical protein